MEAFEIGDRPQFSFFTVGPDANAFYIIGAASRVAQRCGKSAKWITAYQEEATRGDYGHVIATTETWFDCEGRSDDE